MRIISGVVPGVSRLARLQVKLSKKARQRLKWFDYYHSRGYNTRLTCRHFDISPQTFYRWKRRYNPRHLESLEDRSHHPKHIRQPTYPTELVVLLQEKGVSCSTSTVGRIIGKLKKSDVLKEPVSNHISARKRQRQRPYAIRKPKDYGISLVGEIWCSWIHWMSDRCLEYHSSTSLPMMWSHDGIQLVSTAEPRQIPPLIFWILYRRECLSRWRQYR